MFTSDSDVSEIITYNENLCIMYIVCNNTAVYVYNSTANMCHFSVILFYITLIRLFMRLRKLCDFVVWTKILFLINNICANQIPGQSTCIKKLIFERS